jgi:DNA end-binding protein Ku
MARAMWKAVLRLSDVEVPIKLFAGVEERGLHFRLLHAKDGVPVKQRMVDAVTGEEVASSDIRRVYEAQRGLFVELGPEDVRVPDPNPARIIEVTHAVPRRAIDLGWYARPYYLDPDGSSPDFFALASALESADRLGVARWTMRNTGYFGVLAARDGYLKLITLHSPEEIVPVRAFEQPAGSGVSAGERKLAEQLVSTLDAPFDPSMLRDDYREKVLALLESKATGKKPPAAEKPRPRSVSDLTEALQRSIRAAKERKVA